MKQTISLFLVLVMCLSLCACGSSNAEQALVGQWKSLEDGDVIDFKEDGTGTWRGHSFEWEYDEAEGKYAMTAIYVTTTFEIVEENGVRSLTPPGMFSPWKYYHIDDIEKIAE